MPDITLSTGTLPKFNKEVLDKIVSRLSNEARQLAKSEVQKGIRKVGAVASGQLLKSVTSDFTKLKGSGYLVSVGSTDRAAQAIEEGLPPTVVDLNDIFKWMDEKGIGQDPAIAKYIQHKLATVGYEGRKVFENAETELENKLDELVLNILNDQEFYK